MINNLHKTAKAYQGGLFWSAMTNKYNITSFVASLKGGRAVDRNSFLQIPTTLKYSFIVDKNLRTETFKYYYFLYLL